MRSTISINEIHQGREPHETWVVGHGRQAVRHFEAPPAGVSPTMTRHNLGRDTEGASSRRARRRASDVPAGVVVSTSSPRSPSPKVATNGGGRVRDRRRPLSAFIPGRHAPRHLRPPLTDRLTAGRGDQSPPICRAAFFVSEFFATPFDPGKDSARDGSNALHPVASHATESGGYFVQNTRIIRAKGRTRYARCG